MKSTVQHIGTPYPHSVNQNIAKKRTKKNELCVYPNNESPASPKIILVIYLLSLSLSLESVRILH